MANTYQALSTVTVGAGGVAEILFSDIPQTYTDLVLVWSTRLNSTSVATRFTLNANSSAIYNQRRLYASGGTTGGDASTGLSWFDFKGNVGSSYTANVFSNSYLYIPNYASTSQPKTVNVDFSSENNSTTVWEVGFSAGQFSSNDPVTSIKVWRATDTIEQYSTVAIYGIKNS